MARRSESDRLREEVDDLLSELWRVPRFIAGLRGFRPQTDCFRRDDPPELTVVVDLAGVDPREVEIVVSGRTLAIAGERGRPGPPGRIYHQMEIEYGPFCRELRLPDAVDTERATATYRHGMLTIVLPLAAKAAPGEKVSIPVKGRP